MRTVLLFSLCLLAGPAAADMPRIVADTPVTASLIRQVTGPDAEVTTLLDKGADAHHFQMRPSQARALADADLLIWMGPALTPWLVRGAEMLDEHQQLALMDLPGTALREYDSDGHGDQDHGDGPTAHNDQDEAHQHADHIGDHGEEDSHAHGGTDPHSWLNPDNASLWLDRIAQTLGERDPENAENYAANSATAQAELATTANEIRALLSASDIRPFVTFHDAYGYFTEYFDLPAAIAVSIGDASAPSAARLNVVRDQIADSGAVCAFPESNQPRRMIETVIQGTDVELGQDLSPNGSDFEPGSVLYNDLLMQIAQRIAACPEGEA